jgi:hypothetical protein
MERGMVFIEGGERYFWEYPASMALPYPQELLETAHEVWENWCRANEKFGEFWRVTFGENNDRWKPPVDIEEVIKLV